MEFKIKTDDKPHLNAMLENPATKKRAMEVIGTFVALMEEACDPEKGITWVDLPKEFSPELSFRELIFGILRGSLDLKDIDRDTFDVLKVEAHPLSMLAPRKSLLGGWKYPKWREHFRMGDDAEISEDTIANIFRKLLRYYKYVDVESLAQAMINKQVKTFEGLGERNMRTLPFVPALKWQKTLYGDLGVGRFLDEIGFLDGGEWTEGDSKDCPACQSPEIVDIGKHYKGCLACNIGFTVKDL